MAAVRGILAALICLPLFAQAAQQEKTPPVSRAVYTLFIEVEAPHDLNRVALLKALNAEGLDAHAESDREVSIALTAGELEKLFGARVVRRTVEKSATGGSASVPYLEGARIPARFRKLMRRVYFDPQRG